MELKFNHNHAYGAMENLTSEQASKWVRIANAEYDKLIKLNKGKHLQDCNRRAISKANTEIVRLCGITKQGI